MTRINYPSVSPYSATPQTSWYISNFVYRQVPPSTDDIKYTIEPKYHLRPDLLASKLYGKAGNYWVFYIRNRNVINDPIWGFKAGIEIIVPSALTVDRVNNS